MPTYKVRSKVCLVVFLSMAVSCGGDDGVGANDDGGDTPDTTAPASVADLDTPLIPPSSPATIIPLTWTAPGDDGTVGTAAQYDIRYSSALITDANFNSATQAPNLLVPSAAGTSETFDVTGLTENTTYYFALKTADEVPNSSGLSNVINATTPYAIPQFVLKWGSPGSGDGQFNSASDVAVDGGGNVYVTDELAHRSQKFDGAGTFLTKWGSEGSGDGQFDGPEDIAVDGSGNVYVADLRNHRIQKFDDTGTFLTKWGSQGSGDGQLNFPKGIGVDGSGNVYVVDTNNHRIQKFDDAGTFLTKWGSSGGGDGQFLFAKSIAVDGSGNVYVADDNNHRIQKFDDTGTFLTKWGSMGSNPGQFNFASDVAVDGSGNVYVVDSSSGNVQKFN